MGELYFKFWFFSRFLLFVGVGYMMIAQGVETYLLLSDAENWIEVQCEISGNDLGVGLNKKGEVTFDPVVNYVYEYKEQAYSNTVVSLGKGNSQKNKYYAKEFLKQYPIGEARVVFVNPSNAEESALFLRDKNEDRILIYFGLISILIGYLINRKSIDHLLRKLLVKSYSRKDESWLIAK